MNAEEKARLFMKELGLDAGSIDAASALAVLEKETEDGLRGRKGLPMRPAFLDISFFSRVTEEPVLCMDIGGSTLKSGLVAREEGRPVLRSVKKQALPGLDRALTEEEFFSEIARLTGLTAETPAVGISFSHNMESLPGADARLLGWCKELKVTGESGLTVAQAFRKAAGNPDLRVSVLNDSVAAMAGCLETPDRDEGVLGLIVGTGFNICCAERDGRIYNTEAGESRAFPENIVDQALDLASELPGEALAEKKCSGLYLEELIHRSLTEALSRGLLTGPAENFLLPLRGYDSFLTDPKGEEGLFISGVVKCLEERSAKIAALASFAFIRRSPDEVRRFSVACEGSVLLRMPFYRDLYLDFLSAAARDFLPERALTFRLFSAEGAGLLGAAKAASKTAD